MKEIIYSKYLSQPDALPFSEAMEIYENIIDSLGDQEEGLLELWRFTLHAMTEYADLRANWLQQTKEEHHEAGRTAKHDAVIHSLDMFRDAMGNLGLDVSWRNQLGDARKRIGDFACYVALIYGITAR